MFILVFKGLVEAQTALSLWRPGPDPMSVLGEIWRKCNGMGSLSP